MQDPGYIYLVFDDVLYCYYCAKTVREAIDKSSEEYNHNFKHAKMFTTLYDSECFINKHKLIEIDI